MSAQQKQAAQAAPQRVRVYQTQSRLIGLHAMCSLIVARITGCVSPRFTYQPKQVSARRSVREGFRVKKGQPAFKGEAARLNVCELCEFRAMPEREFVATYNVLSHSLRPLQSADDKALTLAQLEIMEFVRVERVEAKLAREAELAEKQFKRYERAKPADVFPPKRPAKSAPFKFNVEGATGEGHSAKLPDKRETTAQRLDRTDPVQCPICGTAMQRAVKPYPLCPKCGHDVHGPEQKLITSARPAKPTKAEREARNADRSLKGWAGVILQDKSERDPVTGVVTRVALEGHGGQPVPQKASVMWLRGERDGLLRAMSERKLTEAETARLASVQKALALRGVE